jgi:hypothetical protein
MMSSNYAGPNEDIGTAAEEIGVNRETTNGKAVSTVIE